MSSMVLLQRPFQPAPEVQRYLDQIRVAGNDLDNLSRKNVAVLRAAREERARHTLWTIPVESIHTLTVPVQQHAVAVRLYVPQDKHLARAGKLPVVVFFHGGGWTLGSPTSYDSITRALARQIPALVFSVDYRLAPEHPFPAALQDAEAVLQWVKDHALELGGDTERVAVAGDSGGGTLATVLALRARAKDGCPLAMQVLFYPSTDIASTDYESYRQYGTDHALTQKAVESFREFYLPNPSDWKTPEASPLRAEQLERMPLTLIVAAGCDPLRDEGKAYAQKLCDQGVEVIYRLEPQLIHAFLNLYNIEPTCSPLAEGVLGYAAGVMRQILGSHRKTAVAEINEKGCL